MLREEIQALQTEPPEITETESSVRQRFESFIDEGRQLLDLEAQLDTLKDRTESTIDQLLALIVLFIVQTILVPIGAFWLALGAFRWFWSWLRTG